MAMNDPCLPVIQGCRIRIARLFADGVPEPGAENLYVSRSLFTLALTNVFTDGTEIEEKNACDEVEIYYKGPATYKRVDAVLTLMQPDPYLEEMLGQGELLDATEAIGFKAPALGLVGDNALSLEVWQKRIKNGKLDPQYPYLRWAFPFATNMRPGDFQIGNEALKPGFSMELYENENWFDGPLNDWPDESDRVYQAIPDTTLPDYDCGYLTLAAS
jgi:hypothetical protein